MTEIYKPNPDRQVAALPFDQWPLWAKQISAWKQLPDKGVGDTAKRILGDLGGEAFKKGFKAFFGYDCGCELRRTTWNKKYPYEN